VLSSVHTTRVHGPCVPVFTGRSRGHGPWTRCHFLTPVSTARNHGRHFGYLRSRAVNTSVDTGSVYRALELELVVLMILWCRYAFYRVPSSCWRFGCEYKWEVKPCPLPCTAWVDCCCSARMLDGLVHSGDGRSGWHVKKSLSHQSSRWCYNLYLLCRGKLFASNR